MADGSKVRVELDLDELMTSNSWETQRKFIDEDGARGLLNGFGQMRVVVNGEPVLLLHIHEDRQGRVELEITNIRHGEKSGMPTMLELERDGIVPARTGRKN